MPGSHAAPPATITNMMAAAIWISGSPGLNRKTRLSTSFAIIPASAEPTARPTPQIITSSFITSALTSPGAGSESHADADLGSAARDVVR